MRVMHRKCWNCGQREGRVKLRETYLETPSKGLQLFLLCPWCWEDAVVFFTSR